MKARRMYFARGTKDCPLESYYGRGSKNTDPLPMSHYHPQLEIGYCLDGKYDVFIEKEFVSFCEGEIVLIPPDEIHYYTCTADEAHLRLIDFSLELVALPEGHFFHNSFIKPLREGTLRLPRRICPEDACYEEAKKHLEQIVSAQKESDNYKSQVFLGALGFLLAILPMCRIIERNSDHTEPGVKGNELVKKCHQYICKYYGNQITLEDLANLVHVHPNYLCRVFKKYTGQTVFENINAVRVSYATNHIRNTTLSLRQIAEKCGFNSFSYFTKRFKAQYGITPTAYYKLYRNL